MTAFITESKRNKFPTHIKNKVLFFESEKGRRLIEDIEKLRNKKIEEKKEKR